MTNYEFTERERFVFSYSYFSSLSKKFSKKIKNKSIFPSFLVKGSLRLALYSSILSRPGSIRLGYLNSPAILLVSTHLNSTVDPSVRLNSALQGFDCSEAGWRLFFAAVEEKYEQGKPRRSGELGSIF
ncbi:unnamed protein product [Coffea canephora]|uniref:Uncharacterized protein n=1 Tax=Coffea canephora TaxID=49390 RepID=A0A068UTT3_COFCA|nr:unnamed protein product [Coffea canephora]